MANAHNPQQASAQAQASAAEGPAADPDGERFYLEVIDRIEAIRGKNNRNWMDLLRLAFRHAPHEAAQIVAGIYQHDQEISTLAKMLVDGPGETGQGQTPSA